MNISRSQLNQMGVSLPPPTRGSNKLSLLAGQMRRESFEKLCVAAGLPAPRSEFRFRAERRWRFDFAWPDHMVALEQDGGIWTRGRHTRGKGWLADTEKLNAAAEDGWRMLRCTPDQLRTAAMIETIRRALYGPRRCGAAMAA